MRFDLVRQQLTKPLVRLGIVALLLIAIAPLYAALPFPLQAQSIGGFVDDIAITLAFVTILFFLWDAIQLIGRKHIFVPFVLALVTLVVITLLNAIEYDVGRATAGVLGEQNGGIYRAYYDLLDLAFIVILYAGIIEIVKKYRHTVAWRHFIAVGFFILVLWLLMGGFDSKFNTFLCVFLVAMLQGSRLIPRAEREDDY